VTEAHPASLDGAMGPGLYNYFLSGAHYLPMNLSANRKVRGSLQIADKKGYI